jgi:hypothetical protein
MLSLSNANYGEDAEDKPGAFSAKFQPLRSPKKSAKSQWRVDGGIYNSTS